MANASDEKYTKPELRQQIKEELQQSDKGGAAGEWSARKSQLLVQEYERRGGGYTSNKRDDAAKSLEHWTEQDWQTKEGQGEARTTHGTKRYLPKKVWDKLSDEEKREAERTKTSGSRKNEQHIAWPAAVQRAMRALEQEKGGPTRQALYDQAKKLDIAGRSSMSKQQLQHAIDNAKKS